MSDQLLNHALEDLSRFYNILVIMTLFLPQ